MKGWLAYSGAFVCAFGAAALCYMAAFYALMSGGGYGIEGFILLAVICPVAAGLIVFGVSWTAFSGQSVGVAGWAQGLAFIAATTAVTFGLIVGNVVGELLSTILFALVLFVGGKVMISRAIND